MKVIKSFILLFVFCIFSINAQTYKSVLDNDTARWSFVSNRYGSRTSSWMTSPNNTEMINGKTYHSLYKFSVSYSESSNLVANQDLFWQTYSPKSFWTDLGLYLRESGDYSKLYLYNKSENKEYIVSDLSLNVGDTFNYKLPYTHLSTDYPTVDSVYYKYGLKHIRFNSYFEIGTANPQLTFIESIGTNFGLLYMFMNSGNDYGECLQCHYKTNLFYKTEIELYKGLSCFFDISAGVGEVRLEPYKIKKTPTTMQLQFETESKRIIHLYDLIGRKLLLLHSSERDINIPVCNVDRGTYIMRLDNVELNISQSIKVKI